MARFGRRSAVVIIAVALGSGQLAGQNRGPRVLDLSRPVEFFIGTGEPGEGYRSSDAQLARWALQAWQRAVGSTLTLASAPETSARVRVYWAGPGGGQYGEMRSLLVGGQLGAAVFIRPDVDALGPDIAAMARTDSLVRESIVYLTCVHELGHAFGLEHTADVRDIMYSFQFGGDIVEYFSRYRRQVKTRDDLSRVSPLSDADVLRVRSMYPAQ